MRTATADAPALRGFDLTPLAVLFVLTLRQHLRGRRLLVLSLLFLLPSGLALLVRLAPHAPEPEEAEFAFVFNLIPHALATLTALLFGAGIIQDEVEEQTLTYLLVRPLPRWALYVTRLAATLVVTTVLTGAFTTLTLGVIYWDTAGLWGEVLPGRAGKTVALLALAQVGYCSLFGALSLVTRRSLIAGLAYVIAFEGLLANIDFVGRQLTVMYYFRVLAVRWLGPGPDTVSPSGLPEMRGRDPDWWRQVWSLDLSTAPGASACVLTLLGASALFVLLGAVMMMRREFRMKTPEGS
jgi:ABC-2 type transport system permease protein